MNSTATAAGIAYIHEDRVLLLKRAPDSVNGGLWAFPGGSIELGETPEETAIRESYEETGYAPNGNLEFVRDDGQFITYKITGEHFTPIINSEHTAHEWVSVQRLPADLHPGIRETLQQIGGFVASNRVTDFNGWYEVRGNPISKVGVFPYSGKTIGADPDKVYNVYRPEEELSNPETIASFKLLPFVNDHPDIMLGSAENDLRPVDQKPIEGIIGEQVYYENGFLYGNLKIFTDRVAQAIDAGKREVSAGFRCMYEKASGVFNGQPYEYIQRHIRGNHAALVNQGRMGPEVAVLDRLTLTFDAKELIKMADPVKDEATKDEGGGEMTVTQLGQMVSQIVPAIQQITEMLGKLSAPASAAPVTPADDEDIPPAAAAATAEDTKTGMDAATDKRVKALEAEIAALKGKGNGMDAKEVFAAASRRDELYKGVSAVVGAFDHAAMDENDVAKYAVEKLGLKNVPAGAEVVAVSAFLQAKPAASRPGSALDSKTGDKPSAIRQHVAAV